LDAITLLNEFAVPFLPRDSGWVTVKCPYHNDTDDLREAHGGVNTATGGFNCFVCAADGNVLQMIAKKMGVPVEVVEAHNDNIFGTNNKARGLDSDDALVSLCEKNLLGSEDYIKKIYTKHGINLNTIKKFRLGLYPSTGRVTIPIMSPDGTIGDIRQYKYGELGIGEGKIISKRGAKTHLFTTCDPLKEDTIYLTEGEFKAMILYQNGFPAVSSTHGASSWHDSFDKYFKNKNVIIIYDVDKPGRKNAEKRANSLASIAKTVKNVMLHDVADIENGDITDYFVLKGFTAEQFKEVVDNTPVYQPYVQPDIVECSDAPVQLHLAASSKAIHNGKLIETNAIISAKDTAPYIIPRKVQVSCGRGRDYCMQCPVFDHKGEYEIEISPDSASILDLIAAKGNEKLEVPIFKNKGKIYPGCKVVQFVTKESMNVEELRVIPPLEVGHATQEQVTRKVFYVGSNIGTNASYALSARVTSMPGDGHATLVVYKAEPTVDNIDNFTATEDLSLFKPIEWTVQAVEDKLNEIYTDYESNVTRIKQRRDLHFVYDLAFHSVLYIPYEGRNIKGWADILVIGDSGQGKSEASSRMSIHYKAGERIDSKRASVAGIVGGLQETSNRWFVCWGSIPLNDRRLVILEEVKGMGVGELTKLTDMRSSGFAEINKIERAKTHARTRLIWISNPRSDNKIGAYNYGVDAVRELIGSLEDIRRFDLVCAVASGEVDISVINSQHTATVPHRYTTEKCSELVQWAWSRKERDIQVGADTIQAALNASSRLASVYSSAIPIVEPSDQRLKMIRLATALAARTFSTDDGENLIVRPCHVEAVERLLDRLYKSKALGYYDFSCASKNEDKLTDVTKVKEYVDSMPHASEAARCMLEAENIRVEDLQNFTDWPLEKCNDMLGNFVRSGCLKRMKRGGYRKTTAFIDQLKAALQDGNLSNQSFKEQLQAGSEL
jgi:hypothetical protein